MITNIASKRVLVRSSRIIRSVFLKALGLMFSRPINDFGLVFSFSSQAIRPLHMFFVFYPIDVLFLDSQKRIVEIKTDFRPFTAYSPACKSQYILELPKGKAKGCRLGDKIRFQ
ncbi:MAG: DUF192 domain-containing protein [Nanoarchaeota archaeon]|nr:DUF192 domain-containing protein [Nanoarchaeota archaeon]